MERRLIVKRAFTLVELLVVISIMSILAAATTWSLVGSQNAGREGSARGDRACDHETDDGHAAD